MSTSLADNQTLGFVAAMALFFLIFVTCLHFVTGGSLSAFGKGFASGWVLTLSFIAVFALAIFVCTKLGIGP